VGVDAMAVCLFAVLDKNAKQDHGNQSPGIVYAVA
jgi:hypothetical protein